MTIDIKQCKKAFTHAGAFHADDVFSSALLLLLNPEITIERGFVVPEVYDGIVFDIGGGCFDHHQENRRVRSNGITYAAFGLLWETYGTLILDSEEAEKFDENFIQPLDHSDNTGEQNELARVISDFNATWKHPNSNSDDDFYRAVNFAKNLLTNRFEQIKASKEAFDIVKKQMQKATGHVLVLDKPVPWKKAVIGSQFYYVIYQSKRGGYNIQAVPEEEGSLNLVKPFPTEWRGQSEESLYKLTGVLGFQFCHMSGFLCVTNTLEEARRIAELALIGEQNCKN